VLSEDPERLFHYGESTDGGAGSIAVTAGRTGGRHTRSPATPPPLAAIVAEPRAM